MKKFASKKSIADKIYRETHKEELKEYFRQYHIRNREKIIARVKQWHKDNYVKKGLPKGTNHHLWKGDEVQYCALHKWVYRQLGKAKQCEYCKDTENVQWANKSREYKRDITDWIALCAKCHMSYDNRVTVTSPKICLVCGKSFSRKIRKNIKWWKTAKFCSYKCSGFFKRGKPKGEYVYV